MSGGQIGDIYNLEYTSINGCTEILEIDLQQASVLEIEIEVSEFNCGNNISCNGANDASIELSFPVSESSVEVSWTSFPTGNIPAGQENSPLLTNLLQEFISIMLLILVLNLDVMKMVPLKLLSLN